MKHPAKSGRNNPARHLNLERIYKSNNPAVTRFMVRCMVEELANANPGSVRDALAASDRIALRTAREFSICCQLISAPCWMSRRLRRCRFW